MSLDAAKAIFEVDGNQFEILDYHTEISQNIDPITGRVTSKTKQGTHNITVRANEKSDALAAYAWNPTKKSDSTLNFRNPEEDGNQYTININQGILVSFRTLFNSEQTMVHQMVITAPKGNILGIETDNMWTA